MSTLFQNKTLPGNVTLPDVGGITHNFWGGGIERFKTLPASPLLSMTLGLSNLGEFSVQLCLSQQEERNVI